MAKKSLKIVSVSSEISPYSKTGGLADVAASLPRALNRAGHKVMCITPLYGRVINKKKHNLKIFKKDVPIKIDGNNTVKVNFWKGGLTKGVKIYFIENEKYFSRRREMKNIYGSKHENRRFIIFDLATLKLLTILKKKVDIIQCHDWHTGLIPYFINRDFKDSSILKNTATIFTIHNLIFQLGHSWWEIPKKERDDGKSKLPDFEDPKIENINFARRAVLNADIINTVSETYAEEVIQDSEKGQGLHNLIRNRDYIFYGIVNGIEHTDYNPETDPGLKTNYSFRNFKNRYKNKLFIQKKYKLKVGRKTPLLVSSSRIAHQKGFEIILKTLPILLRFDIGIIIMGDGSKKYISEIKKLSKKYPKKLAYVSWEKDGPKYETSLYAGGDMFLLPSTSEPCGINQMKALRYGCIPIVRSIGGLRDTITNFDFNNKEGNGFTFHTYSSLSLYGAIVRALEYYKNEKIWQRLIKNGMQISFSWNLPATQYIRLFEKAIKRKKGS